MASSLDADKMERSAASRSRLVRSFFSGRPREQTTTARRLLRLRGEVREQIARRLCSRRQASQPIELTSTKELSTEMRSRHFLEIADSTLTYPTH